MHHYRFLFKNKGKCGDTASINTEKDPLLH
jgi:hypothetical protein